MRHRPHHRPRRGSCCTLVQRGSTTLSEPDAIIIDWDGLPESPSTRLLELRGQGLQVPQHQRPDRLDNLIADSDDDQDHEDDGTDEFGSDEDERGEGLSGHVHEQVSKSGPLPHHLPPRTCPTSRAAPPSRPPICPSSN